MEPLTARELFRLHVQQAEYLHVVLNPLVIYGLAVGSGALLVALLARSIPAQRLALGLVAFCALAAWPVAHYGETAYNQILMLADEDGRAWLDAHRDRAAATLPLFYATSALAVLALVLPWKWPPTRLPFTVLALIMALGALGCAAWVGYAGGKIRHKEFRYGPPPPSRWEGGGEEKALPAR